MESVSGPSEDSDGSVNTEFDDILGRLPLPLSKVVSGGSGSSD